MTMAARRTIQIPRRRLSFFKGHTVFQKERSISKLSTLIIFWGKFNVNFPVRVAFRVNIHFKDNKNIKNISTVRLKHFLKQEKFMTLEMAQSGMVG
jgi:hypothetical protein